MKKTPLSDSFRVAFKGIFIVLITERNFQIHSIALIINLILMTFFQMEKWEIVILLLCCAVVLSLEMVNCSIEMVCNYIQPEFDEAIGKIKDISAGAVLCASLISIVIGAIIYFPYFKQLIFGI